MNHEGKASYIPDAPPTTRRRLFGKALAVGTTLLVLHPLEFAS